MALEITPGLVERHDSLLECVQASVYQFGLKKSAAGLNVSVGNLSAQLNIDNPDRHMSIENLELFIEKTGDVTAVLYLAEKFLIKKDA